jgi:YbgC/YbaW family acyl-CoA thioester hydrolase
MGLVADSGPAREALLDGEARFVERREVRFQDIDAAGIVFFPRLVEYLHDAYVAFLAARGCPLPPVLASGSWAAPIRHVEAEFLRPLRFGDSVEVALVGAAVRETEFTLGYRIAAGGRAAAIGRTLHVTVDRTSFRRIPLPEALAEALRTLG